MTSSNCAIAWGRFYAELASNDQISKVGTSTKREDFRWLPSMYSNCIPRIPNDKSGMSGGQEVTKVGTDVEKLREQANKILLEAARTGALDGALAEAKKSQAGKEDTEELRRQAMQCLLEARKTGALETALANTKGGAVHAVRFCQLAKQILVQGVTTGALDAALTKMRSSQASTEEDEELRQQAKATLLEATKTGALDTALANLKKKSRQAEAFRLLMDMEEDIRRIADHGKPKVEAVDQECEEPQDIFSLLSDMEEDIKRMADNIEKQKMQPEVDTAGVGVLEAETAGKQRIDDPEKESRGAVIQSLLTSCFEDISALKERISEPKEEAGAADIPDIHRHLEDMEKLIEDLGEPQGESSTSTQFAGHSAWTTLSAAQAVLEQTYVAMMMAQRSFGYMKEQSETVLQIPDRLLQMLAQIKSCAEPQAASGEVSDSMDALATALLTEDEKKAKQKSLDDLMTSCSGDIDKLNEETPKAEPSATPGFASAAQAVSEQALKAKLQMQRSFEYMKEQSESVRQVPEQMQRYAAEKAESAREKAHAVSATLTVGTKKALDMAMSMRAAKVTSQQGGA